MQDNPIGQMSVENVEDFDAWIFDSEDLVVAVIPHHDPLNAMTEIYGVRHN
jgi:hypothetical protein